MDVQFEARILCNSKPLCCRWDPFPRSFSQTFSEPSINVLTQTRKTESFWNIAPWSNEPKGRPSASHSHLGWRLKLCLRVLFSHPRHWRQIWTKAQPPCHIAKSVHHFGSFHGRFTHETTRVHRAPTSVVFCDCQQIHAQPCKPPATKGYSHGLPKCQKRATLGSQAFKSVARAS